MVGNNTSKRENVENLKIKTGKPKKRVNTLLPLGKTKKTIGLDARLNQTSNATPTYQNLPVYTLRDNSTWVHSWKDCR
jgi:hypothetical protein